MTCPFCRSAINAGATVCANCGATEIAQRPTGRVLALGCLFPIVAMFVLAVVFFVPSVGRGGEPSATQAFGFALMCLAWVLGLILAARVPKKPVWVRRIG